ncbi:MAG TPA: radical SAM protein [Sphingomicrobium sp.]|jgi:anaerobic magnesium-protoporphyrin IX monomethyl ester cyclase|nr:radical SAM protein [Sphingomicrobium sp.]
MILLAHSNFIARDPKQQARMKPYSPLSTLITAALLRREGHQVAFFDATFEPGLSAFEEKLDEANPDVVLLMEDNFNFLTKMCTTERRESALAMIALAAGRGCNIAVNGPDASDNPAIYLCAGADAIVVGEGEMGMLDVANHWADRNGVLTDIHGLILPGAGQAQPTRSRRPQQDLDCLPHPAWDLLDIDAYRSAWVSAHHEFSWNIATSRGCPYACNWCAKPTFGRRYSVRSPEDVALEMQRLREDIAPDHLWFTDDILGLDVDWICAFADEVERADAQISFTMQSRANLMTERSVAAMARAGAREVWLGIESGSQKILDAMDKGTTVEAGRSATRLLKERGIRACWFIQLGYPSETWDDLLATRDLIRDEQPDEIGVSVAYPLPGTVFYERVRAQLGRQRNWRDTGDLAMLFQGTFDTELYRYVRDILHKEVESGFADHVSWNALEDQVHLHRSPEPLHLAVGT